MTIKMISLISAEMQKDINRIIVFNNNNPTTPDIIQATGIRIISILIRKKTNNAINRIHHFIIISHFIFQRQEVGGFEDGKVFRGNTIQANAKYGDFL